MLHLRHPENLFTAPNTTTRWSYLLLRAGAHGRNETPYNAEVDLHDKIRNTAIALMTRAGLSGGQLQKLVNGLIEYKEK